LQLREVLEKLLDDDDDLHDMNLTAKESERAQGMLRAASRSGVATPFDVPLPLRSGGLDVRLGTGPPPSLWLPAAGPGPSFPLWLPDCTVAGHCRSSGRCRPPLAACCLA
jgi:hypothetical protein